MKIELLVGRSGINLSQSPGDIIDVSDAEGTRMIAANQAVPVRAEKKERAVKFNKSEKAIK